MLLRLEEMRRDVKEGSATGSCQVEKNDCDIESSVCGITAREEGRKGIGRMGPVNVLRRG